MPLEVHLTDVTAAKSVLQQVLAYIGPIGATLVGALAGFAASFYQSRSAERRRDDAQIRTARRSLYSEIYRASKIADNQFGFTLDNSHNFVWVPMFRSLLPSNELRAMIQMLSPHEAYDVTDFVYGYQEHIGYILGNASHMTGRPDLMEAKVTSIGYDFSDAGRRQSLRWSLHIIESSARRAADVLASALRKAEPGNGDLMILLDENAREESKRRTLQYPSADGPF